MVENVHKIDFFIAINNQLIKLMNLFWKEMVFGGHLFAVGSVAVILVCATLFRVHVGLDILFCSYLLFYAIYLYDYLQGVSSDELTNSSRARYLRSKHKAMCTVLITSVLLVALLLLFANIVTTFIGISILVLGLFYGSYFKKITKMIPAFKNFFVSFVWSFMVLFVFIYYSLPITYGALMLALFIFIRMMNIQILFDVRDAESDRKDGLLTIPALFSDRQYPFILRSVNSLSILFVTVCVILGLLPLLTLAVIPMFYYAATYINNVLKCKKNYSSYVFAACEPIMWSVLIFAGQYITMLGIL
ncbi:UbiA family prenyltransferase [Methanolobus sp. WCC5]|uniref:UbiA family prenyltransferase n=1 Tax=Methanolobus sp. WCC5 TaxID=3125785 RepID=UPI00324E1985